MSLSDKELQDTLDAYNQYGSAEATALATRLTVDTVRRRIAQATQRGIGSIPNSGRLPPGMLIDKVSMLHAADGELKLQWTKGSIVLPIPDMVEAMKDGLADIKPLDIPDEPKNTNDDFLTVYPLADLHLGMYTWAEETGANYDVEHGTQLLLGSVASLARRSEPTDSAILLNLGDFFHSDSDENRTRRSGAALDVDTRYARVLRTGVRVAAQSALLLLERHRRLTIRSIPGNHDPYGALALQIALAETFRGNERVTVDLDPGPFWAYQFGRVMLGAAHGDTIKPETMPGVFAAKYPAIWGSTDYRYGLMGHRHRFKRIPSDENHGMQVEVFQTLAPKDAWNNAQGYTSGRSMSAILYSLTEGDIGRMIQPVGGPR